MKVALSVHGVFHSFDLARELYARGSLAGILTAYPRFKLRAEGLPQELIHTFPLIHGAYRAFPWRHRIGVAWERQWERLDATSFAAYVGRNLPRCDVYVGMSGTSLAGGRRAHRMGARYICDRGSSHVRVQDRIEREEGELWGLPAVGVDPRVIDAEEAEYAAADRITVPSGFVYRTFLSEGVAPEKLRKLPMASTSPGSDQTARRLKDASTFYSSAISICARASSISCRPLKRSSIRPKA